MSDLLQFIGLFLLPVGAVLFFSVFFGWIGAVGVAIMLVAIMAWFIGREMNLANQRAKVEAEERALVTGWTEEERQRLGSTNG